MADSDLWGLRNAALTSAACRLSNGPQEDGAISKLASPSSSGLLARALYLSAHKVSEGNKMTTASTLGRNDEAGLYSLDWSFV